MTHLEIDSLELVTGGVGLRAVAKRAAIDFAAGSDGVPRSRLRVTGTVDFGVGNRRRWFGVDINNGQSVNVGLDPKSGIVRKIYYAREEM